MNIRKIKSRGTLFTFDEPGWGLNIYLIQGKNYNYLIDTGLGSLCTDPIKEYLKEKKTIVINTHYHWDHIWGNGAFQEETIIAHKLCYDMIQDNWDEMLCKKGNYQMGEVYKRLPDLLFDNELYFKEDHIRLFYTPGHTIDSISVLDEEDKVLLASDNIGDDEEDILPNIYNKEIYLNTIQKYKGLDFDFCLSGHNTVLRKDVFDKISELCGTLS